MDIRTMCVNLWGSELGLNLLSQLGELYMSLLWETTVLETVVKEEQDLINENKESTDEKLSRYIIFHVFIIDNVNWQ